MEHDIKFVNSKTHCRGAAKPMLTAGLNYCDLIVERQGLLSEATVQRISRECWDKGSC